MRRLVGLVVLVLGLSVVAGISPVAAEPQPGECEALTSAQVGDPATRLKGTAPADLEDFDCYVLPDSAEGSVYRFTALIYDSVLSVVDGDGHDVCGLRPDECRLTGQPPYTLRISGGQFPNEPYRVQALRVTGENSCPRHKLTSFGSAADAFRTVSGESALLCWKIDLPEGPVMALGRTDWSVYDPVGNAVCDYAHERDAGPFICRTAYTGPAVMTLRTGYPRYDLIPVIPLLRTDGCAGTIGTGWDQPPVMVPALDARVDCHRILAPAGERILPTAGAELHFRDWTMVIDSSGTPACQVSTVYEVGGVLGCRLAGQPPFWLVSASSTPFSPSDPPDYPVVARTLNPGADCPTVQPTPWGAGPADQHPGNGCRQFQATAGQSFVFGSVGEYQGEYGEHGAWVIDQDGKIACIGSPPNDSSVFYPERPCQDLRAGKYIAITEPIGIDIVTMLYDRASFAGCRPRPPSMSLVVTPVAPGQIDCYRVAHPRAGVLAYYDPGDPTNDISDEFATRGQVFRADGTDLNEESCRYALFCLDAADGPHRLIVGDGLLPNNVFTTYTLDDLTDCQRLRRGTTEVRLEDADRFVCVRIDKIATWQEVIEMSTDGATIDSYQARQAIGGVTSCYSIIVNNMPQRALQCGPGDGSSSSLVVLLGHDTPQTVTFVRDAPAVRNRTRPRILGVPRAGQKVRVAPGTWTPSGALLTYQWTVDGRDLKGATKKRLRLRAGFAGKHLTVTVTGRVNGHYQDTAMSKRVLVRR